MRSTKWRPRRELAKPVEIILLLLCVAALFTWMFHMPYQPDRLFKAIPENAFLVSIHERPGADLAALSTNNLLSDMADRMGLTKDLHLDFPRSRTAEKWIERAGSRRTVISYVPSIGGTGVPGWISASWIGRGSIFLRWMFALGRVPSFKEIGSYAGWTIWGIDTPLTDSGLMFSVAAGDGILFSSIARHPAGVKHAIAAYEGLRPSLEREKQPDLSSKYDNRGWVRSGPVAVSYHIEQMDRNALTLNLRVDEEFPEYSSFCGSKELGFPGLLLGALPAILVASPLSMVRNLLEDAPAPWSETVLRFLNSDAFLPDSDQLILAVLTDEYSGGYQVSPQIPLLRMRIPTVLALIKTPKSNPLPLINRLLDDLNASHRMGLIINPSPITIGNYELRMMEATADNILSGLKSEDRPAFTWCENWLILSSNARALSALLTRVQNPETDFERGDWQEWLEDGRAAGLFWMDLESGGGALQLPLVFYSRTSRHAANAGKWLDAARAARTLAVRLEPDTPQPEFLVTIER